MLLLTQSPLTLALVVGMWLAVVNYPTKFLIFMALTFTTFAFVFFRNFDGPVDMRYDVIVAPCDGRVMSVEETPNGTHIAVRLSLIDRHVQAAPYEGRVLQQTHRPGTFHPVYWFDKTDYNERVDTVFKTPLGPITVSQIAGQIANRIVSFVSVGQYVEKGAVYGMIKFGSRVDVRLPRGVRCLVTAGDVLRIGHPIAQLNGSFN